MQNTYIINADSKHINQYFLNQKNFRKTKLLKREYKVFVQKPGTTLKDEYTGRVNVASAAMPYVLEVSPAKGNKPANYEFLSERDLVTRFVRPDGGLITKDYVFSGKSFNVVYNQQCLTMDFLVAYIPKPYVLQIQGSPVCANDTRIAYHSAEYIQGDFVEYNPLTGRMSVINGNTFYHKYAKNVFTEGAIKQIKRDADTVLNMNSRYTY